MSLKKWIAPVPQHVWEMVRITGAAFVVLAVIGYAVQRLRPETAAPLLEAFSSMAENSGLMEAEGAELMAGILTNNLSALFIGVLLGVVPFLRLPAMELGTNALLFGALGAYYQQNGIPIALYLAGTLPHGVTELTALTMSCAAGLNLCRAISDTILRRGKPGDIARAFGDAMLLYARFIVPLLILSALIEAFITPLLLSRFF